jgi:hypothetical protein
VIGSNSDIVSGMASAEHDPREDQTSHSRIHLTLLYRCPFGDATAIAEESKTAVTGARACRVCYEVPDVLVSH